MNTETLHPQQDDATDTALEIRKNVVEVESALTEFDKVSQGLAALRDKYDSVIFDVGTAAGMKEASEARMEIRAPRYAVKKIADAAKRPLNDLKRNIQDRADWITGEILKIETPIDQQIKREEERKAEERAARERAEEARLQRIQEGIAEIRRFATEAAAPGVTALEVEQSIHQLEHGHMGDGFEEFTEHAERATQETIAALRQIHADKLAREQEAARIEAERIERDRLQAEAAARLAQERAAFEAERAEHARQHAGRETTRAEAERIERDKRAQADRELQEVRDKLAQAQQEIEAAESKRVAEQNAAVEAQARAAKEQEAATKAAAERAERERQAAVEASIEAEARAAVDRRRTELATLQADAERSKDVLKALIAIHEIANDALYDDAMARQRIARLTTIVLQGGQ